MLKHHADGKAKGTPRTAMFYGSPPPPKVNSFPPKSETIGSGELLSKVTSGTNSFF